MKPAELMKLGARWARSKHGRAAFRLFASDSDAPSVADRVAKLLPIYDVATAMCVASGGDLEVAGMVIDLFCGGMIEEWYDEALALRLRRTLAKMRPRHVGRDKSGDS